jgi:endoglucanase
MRTSLASALCALVFLTSVPALAAPVSQAIKTDHLGYRPADPKIAIFSASPGTSVEVRDTADVVRFRVPLNGGSITSKGFDGPSGDNVWWVDFSAFQTPGTYRLYSPALGAQSYEFAIGDDVYNAALEAALATFYLQRCNTPKLATYVGSWADGASCHMTDTATTAAAGHTSVGSLDLTGGWHDAGDYNKYMWGAVSTAVRYLLLAYERNPSLFPDGLSAIPESGNGVSDLLDEVKYELDWMAKMQLASGAVLSQMHVDGFASDSPPSVDTNRRYYQNPNMESAAVLVGSFAHAARVFAAAGQTSYASTLQTKAITSWNWLLSQSDSAADTMREVKVWAAAELFRTAGTASGKAYVDGFYASSWSGRFYNVARYDTYAALTYVVTPGANPTVVANMRASIGAQVDYQFQNDDFYRNGMPSWSYHWGSNTPRAATGMFMLAAADLGATGGQTAAACRQRALDTLHFFHGQNALNMMYLTNMAAAGGEHSSFQFYHAWFGDSARAFSRSNFMGKPSSIAEPDYPYFKGTDNHGVSDNKVATLGPPPGFVPGGPNASYSGTATPPAGASAANRFYRDWADQTVWTAVTWEITENSIGYQGPYVALVAAFSDANAAGCTTDAECSDGLFCNGSESCDAGTCAAGPAPCTGQSCNEDTDSCFTDPCNHNGACEAGENCDNCADDCIEGGGGGCGNGACETALGEDCLSCPSDCRGQQGGSPKNRFCCGDGAGSGPVGCTDPRCTASGFQCRSTPPVPYCCGDATCSGGAETSCSCALDCGAAPGEAGRCGNGADDDCDGLVDCADPNCTGDAACAGPPCDGDGNCEAGESCTTCSGDCSGRTGGKPKDRYCCGNGVVEAPEGNGSICDGNP